MIDALDMARREYAFQLWAYVIMPEHVHLLIFPMHDDYDLAIIRKTVKQSVARRAIGFLKSHAPEWLDRVRVTWPDGRVEHRFWQQGGGYDRNIRSAKAAWSSVNYLHNNPVRRGLVKCAVDWVWSSARWYEGLGDVKLAMDACPPDPPIE